MLNVNGIVLEDAGAAVYEASPTISERDSSRVKVQNSIFSTARPYGAKAITIPR